MNVEEWFKACDSNEKQIEFTDEFQMKIQKRFNMCINDIYTTDQTHWILMDILRRLGNYGGHEYSEESKRITWLNSLSDEDLDLLRWIVWDERRWKIMEIKK